jgi:hypothetical protein
VFCAARADLDTNLTSAAVSQRGHDGPMEQTSGKTSSRRSGRDAALADKRVRSLALASTIEKLIAAGFVSQRALTDELNRRRILTARGGNWHRTTVVRMLTRLGRNTNGRINTVLAHRRAADVRAESLASIIREFQTGGVVTVRAIACALNEREIPTARRGRWHPCSVSRLLQRLKRLHRPPYRRHRR